MRRGGPCFILWTPDANGPLGSWLLCCVLGQDISLSQCLSLSARVYKCVPANLMLWGDCDEASTSSRGEQNCPINLSWKEI